MNKFVLLFVLCIYGCAKNHVTSPHHHHETEIEHIKFDHHCAGSLAEGDLHIMGKDEFTIKYDGEIYYFSSLEKKKLFESKLKENIEKAERFWGRR